MKKVLAFLLSLFLLAAMPAVQSRAESDKTLNFHADSGTDLLVGETTRLTATLDGEAVDCVWTIEDQSVAKIVSGNGGREAILEAVAPGGTDIYATSAEGLATVRRVLNVAPSFTLALEDGTPLSAQGKGFKKWLLVPEGADSIRLRLDPADRVTNSMSGVKIEPDAGNSGEYTLTFKGTRPVEDENSGLSRKGLNMLFILSKMKPELNYAKYETGAYSGVSIAGEDEEGGGSRTLTICWQLDLPVLETLSASGAVFYTPFAVKDLYQQFVMDKDADEAVISFSASRVTSKVYLKDADSNIIGGALAKKNGVYSFTVGDADFGDEVTVTRYLVLEDERGNKQTIAFTGARRLVDSPDAVVDYLCVGSQYSDGGNPVTGVYGLYPEKSLIGLGAWWSPISLGNFGGYINYYYEEAIRNDPANSYGIDFIVYGNSNGGAGFSEPGNVLISDDGKTWYTLAGSEHYEDGVKWDHPVTYTRGEDGSHVIDGKVLGGMYPSPKNYPLYGWPGDSEKNITVSGVQIPFGSGGHAGFPAFGYADVHTNSQTAWGTGEILTVDCRAKNPYLFVTKQKEGLIAPADLKEIYEGAGDCFDLDWAVDETGMPVELDEIHYIKVQTASLTLSLGGIGEKSTEVNVVARATAGDTEVGVSAPPARILVAGAALPLEDGVYVYTADVKGAFNVTVEADAAANVYINNLRAASRDFAVAPDKGLIRLIVQDGDKEPLIYYIAVNGDSPTK